MKTIINKDITTCEKCNTTFTYEKDDLFEGDIVWSRLKQLILVTCPKCNTRLVVDEISL